MRIDVVTIFPDLIRAGIGYSIIARAVNEDRVSIRVVDLRDFTSDKRRTVDDIPYGGGAGMVLKPEPVFAAVESLVEPESRVILLTPQGEPLTQPKSRELSNFEHLILVCGHYEGFDERIREHLATDEISIGDYVLTGGELPALVLIDSVTRILPGVLGNDESLASESFENCLLEYPHYTRPAVYRQWSVPGVLLSGHHAQIDLWRRNQQEVRTQARRPDLWERFVAKSGNIGSPSQLEDKSSSDPDTVGDGAGDPCDAQRPAGNCSTERAG